MTTEFNRGRAAAYRDVAKRMMEGSNAARGAFITNDESAVVQGALAVLADFTGKCAISFMEEAVDAEKE